MSLYEKNKCHIHFLSYVLFVALAVLILNTASYAQWSMNGSNIYFSGGNVGVGTTNPDRKIVVQTGDGNPNSDGIVLRGENSSIRFVNDAYTNQHFVIGYNASDVSGYMGPSGNNYIYSGAVPLVLNTAGANILMLVNPNGGKVGIGTTTPVAKLHLSGGDSSSSFSNATIALGYSTTGQYPGFIHTRHNGSAGINNAIDFYTGDGTADGVFPTNAVLGLSINNGNVGIGTTNPGAALEVIGTIKNKNASANANYTQISTYEAQLNLLTHSIGTGSYPAPIIFSPADTERMRILDNGNVGIGTTNPTAKLDVAGDINVSGNISAKYQDLAEWVPSTEKIRSGYVVIVDTKQSGNVLPSSEAYDTRVAGVISETPGIVLGESGSDKVKVATVGRVKVRVDATRNPIAIGDLLVTSGSAGTAMKSEPVDIGGIKLHRPGTLIGKALEPLSSGTGEITVLLSLQ